MEKYIVDGKGFNVKPEDLQQFLIKYPNAQKYEEPGKTNDLSTTDTIVRPTRTVSRQITRSVSRLDRGSSEQKEQPETRPLREGEYTYPGSDPFSGIRGAYNLLKSFSAGGLRIADGFGNLIEAAVQLQDPNLAAIYHARKHVARTRGISAEMDKLTDPFNIINLKPIAESIEKTLPDFGRNEDGSKKDFIDLVNEDRLGDAASSFALETVAALPSLLVSMAPGGYALLGASAALEKYEKDIIERNDQSVAAIVGNSIVYGGADAVGEYLGGKYLRSLFKPTRLAGSSKIPGRVKDAVVGGIGGIITAGFKGGSVEFMQEAITSVIQNGGDHLIYGDEVTANQYARQAIHSGLIGFALGGGTGVVASNMDKKNKSKFYEYLAPKSYKVQQTKLSELQEKAEQDLKSAPSNKKEKFQKNVDLIKDKKKKLKDQLFDRFENMEKNDMLLMLDKIQEQHDALDVINGGRLYSNEAKEQAKTEFKEAADVIGDLFAVTDVNYDSKIELDLSNYIRAAEEIDEANKSLWFKSKDLKYEYVNTQEKFDELKKQYGNKIANQADGFFEVTEDGQKKIFINREVAAASSATNVIGHELLHYALSNRFANDPKYLRDSVIAFNQYLDSLPDGKGAYIKKAIERRLANPENDYALLDENGRIQRDSDGLIVMKKDSYIEEYFTMFSDLIKKEKIDVVEDASKGLANTLRTTIRGLGLGFNNVDFKNGQEVFDFLIDYNKNLGRKGLLGAITQRKAIKQAAGKGDKKAKAGTKKSISAKAKKAQEAIDKIGRKATTKAEYDDGVNIEAYNYLIENKGLDGLIIAELNKRGIDTEAADANVNGVPLNDYMEDVRGKLIPDVLGFNPEAEVTKEGKFGLSGYINQRLKFRMGDVATKAKKTVVGKSIETPVGETGRTVAETIEDEGDTRLEAFEEQDLSVSAQNRAIETEQDKNELKSRYRHKLKNADGTKLITEDRVENIREGIRSTLIKLADKAVSPDFLFNFEKIVKKDLKNIIQKAIGTKKQYFEFVSKNMADIVDFTSVQDLVALERLVGQGKLKGGKKIFTVAIRRLTKVEDIQKAINQGKLPVEAINKSKEGVMLYEKRMPTQEELEAFFFGENMQEVLGYKLGASTLGTRKDGLSRMIITELSQDGLMETIQEPDIAEEILSISEQADIDVIVNNVATQVNRSPNLKFSKSLEKIASDPMANPQMRRGAEILVSGDGYQSKAWKKFMDDESVDNKIKLELNINFLQRDKENWYAVRQMKGINAKLKSIASTFKDPKTGKIKRVKTHKKFEIIARQVAQDIFNSKDYSVARLSEKDNAPDIVIYKRSNLNFEVGIEIKGTTARSASKSFNYKEGRGFDYNDIDSSIYSEEAEVKVKKLLKKANNRIEKILKDLSITPEYNKNDNLVITDKQYKTIKKKRLHLDKNFLDFIKAKDVEFMYLNKPRVSHYINLGVSGLFQLGNTNPLNIEGLDIFGDQDIDIPITFRFDFSKPDKNGNRKVGIRIEAQLDSRFFKKQNANLFGLENSNIKIKKSITKDVSTANNLIKASRSDMSKAKGASIFDFDETVGISENFVIATKGNITKTIPSEQWPLVGETLKEEGYTFDFTDFNKVTKGRPGPLLQKMKNQIKKYGPKNVFILTARAPESQQAIHDWLKSEGVNIPIENVTGLGNSTAEAKANWVLDKYANKGYNDMYFVDDALPNVEAVKNIFDQLDIKGKSVQAKVKFSKSMDKNFNDILEDVAGIESQKRFSDAKARKRGEGKGRFRFFIPPSHEDFIGLLYNFIGKGEQGNKHRDFFEKALIQPLNKAFRELSMAKQGIANDYRNLMKQMPDIRKKLTQKTPDGDYTYDDAVRVYLWNKYLFEVPGLSNTDKAKLANLVLSDPQLKAYADAVGTISKMQEGYVEPGEHWLAGSIKQDLADATGRVGRKKFFAEFIENADIIFSKENINKIRAAFGDNFVEALEDMLYAVKNGTNRKQGNNKQVNAFLDYLNGSVAATMFFNARSAVLQTLSTVNFINFADNNIFKAAAAFANQKQFWSDFSMIFNSDYLKQRRAGVGFDVNAAEIAAAVRKSKQPVKAAIAYILNKGFLPTQMADSFAIALGGASMYRNRVNTYLKQGLSQKEAESKAFEDFQATAESTQQSARPDMLSSLQRSSLGRMIFAFQNVTSQYARLIKKSTLDLINRRKSPPYTTQVQSDMSNISKIIYYGAIQNFIFYSLQSALFAMSFEDDEDEEKKNEKFFKTKKQRLINGSIDSILRGSGLPGAILSVVKNAVIKYGEQNEKGWGRKLGVISDELLQISPPVGIKIRKLDSFEKTMAFNKKVIPEMDTFDIDNPALDAYGNLIEGATNVPVARLLRKVENVRSALDSENKWWQRLALALGWSKWELGIEDKEINEIKERIKKTNKQVNKDTKSRRKIRRKIRR